MMMMMMTMHIMALTILKAAELTSTFANLLVEPKAQTPKPQLLRRHGNTERTHKNQHKS